MHKVKNSKKLEQEVNSKVKLKYTQYKTKFFVPKPHCLYQILLYDSFYLFTQIRVWLYCMLYYI